ncbi:MAG: 2-epi-5-epi-valiolone synthase [Streptomyces sp.]|nr:2-epi-5-epi-valiolone synthase [Streptomyces sp.]
MQQDLRAPQQAHPEGLFAVGNPVSHWSVFSIKPVQYEVRISEDLLAVDNTAILEDVAATGRPRRFVVVDSVVHDLYGERIRTYLDHHGVDYRILTLRAGEGHKDLEGVQQVAAGLDEFGIDRRREPVIGIGGGVLLDIVGMACSLYRRGTPHIRIPTTLIGLVDAGVGAKTGVNAGGHKNRMGTYFPASRTLLDRTFLTTLDDRHISNGLAEILKIGLIKDARLFELLERHGSELLRTKLQRPSGTEADHLVQAPAGQRLTLQEHVLDPATEVIQRAVQGMLEELQPNLWEQVLERVVDYGHSFSPTVEMHALPELLHGEAVTVDMALSTVLAERRGLVDASQRARVLRVMDELGLPTWHPSCTPEVLVPALRDTVRHRDGAQRLPLPLGIGGAVFVNDVSEEELVAAVDDLAGLQPGAAR